MTVDFRIFLDVNKKDMPLMLERALNALLQKGARFDENLLPLRYPSIKDLPGLREISNEMIFENRFEPHLSPNLVYKKLSFAFTYSFSLSYQCIFVFSDQSAMRPTHENNRVRAENLIEVAKIIWESLPLNAKIFGVADLEYSLEDFEKEVSDVKKISEPLFYWFTFYGESLSKNIKFQKYMIKDFRVEKVHGGVMVVRKELPEYIVG